MKKRLRKKRRLGEFREFGFTVRFETPRLSTWEEEAPFWDRLIEEIESAGLCCGGSTQDFFVTTMGRGTCTEEHQSRLGAWLAAQSEVTNVRIGPLVDAWHGPFED